MPHHPTDLPEQEQIAADCALAARLIARVPGADRTFLELLRRMALPIVRRIIGPNDAEPVMNELAEHVWDRDWRVIRQWDQRSPLCHYLVRVAKNFAIDEARRRAAQHAGALASEGEEQVETHWTADPQRVQEIRDAQRCLDGALHQLSDPHRRVIRLRHLLDLGHREIADAIGRTVGYVSPTLARAEVALRNALMQRCRILIEQLIGTRSDPHDAA